MKTFAPGAIVSIRLRNFMTYDDCILQKPAPNLNMILGPNGTGKSAIVCAIIVGLAGDVSLTNRAATPGHLIQRGRDWGSTRIELYNDRGKNYVVERKIIITNRSEAKLESKSEWRLNGAHALKADIVKLMAKLNIKVDNLCQFLPQDSVAQFVKMSHSDLLTNTLKAAGDNNLVEQHMRLIEHSELIKTDKRKLEDLKEACKHNELNARRLETEVVRLRERETMVAKRNICKQKVHYVRFQEAEANLVNGQEELKNMESRMQEAKDNADPFKREAEKCKSEEVSLRKMVDELARENHLAAVRITKAKESIEEKKIRCQEEFANFKAKETQETQREQQIRSKQQELDALECRLNEVREVDYGRQISESEAVAKDIKQKLLKTNDEKLEAESSLNNILTENEKFKSRRDNILAIKDRKLQIVASKRSDSYKVIEWLAKNTDKFKHKIHLPMFCEINVNNPENSCYLETIINENDLFAFVCESEEDLKRFTRSAREELRAKINVILMPGKSTAEFESETSRQSQEIARVKPDAYLKDFIQAPEAIMRYLYGQYEIHRVPVFKNDRTQPELKHLLSNCRKFFVGNRFYSVAKSRYDGEQLVASDTVRPARTLIHSLDTKGLELCENKLRELAAKRVELDKKRAQMIKEHDSLNKEWHELAEHLKKMKAKHDEKNRLLARIKFYQESIQGLQTERIDLDAERLKLERSVTKINSFIIRDLENMAKISEKFVESKSDFFLNTLLCSLATRNYTIAHKRYKSAMNEADRLVECINEQKQQISVLEKSAKRLCKEAEEQIDGFKDRKLTKKVKRSFDSIEQNTVDSLEQFIEELKVRIRNICNDPGNSIMREFNRENEELREKQTEISELEERLKQKEASMLEIKEVWLPKLKDVLKVIDGHYQDFMKKLNYGGKVELDFDASNADDFRSYGIMILVRYRDNEDLIPLSSTRQSGGERSVATMIYMLALQTKTTVPFRVVDEINQGMDKDNERKVFELLVRTADESSSQYFLVSPKLLSGLNYGDKMQIHVVFNGKNMDYAWSSLFANGYTSNDTGIDSDRED